MTTKKTTAIVLAIVLTIVAMYSCYKDRENRHYHIPFKNNTEKAIYIRDKVYWSWRPTLNYLDTVLDIVNPRTDTLTFMVNPKEENIYALFNTSFYESWLGKSSDTTLMVFAFDADTLESISWDTVCAKYKVLQRYDLSLEDLQDLDFKLCFPPSEAMEHIHMWPPYGTYDENGNIIDGRSASCKTH
jgi:hypothetical protein